MIKSILVPATGQASDTNVWSAALAVARTSNAHVDALHVRVDPVEVAVTMSADGAGAGGALLQGVIDSLTREANETEAKARMAFADFCQQAPLPLNTVRGAAAADAPSAEWHVESGQEVRWLSAYALTSDLVVMGRGLPGNDAAPRSNLEAVLLGSGRPLLIAGTAPLPPQLGERIAIAWKATPQAARAIGYAMPLLSRTGRVTVLTIDEEGGRRSDTDRLTAYLGWHGIEITVERLSPGTHGAAKTMLAAATERADLLVMGGYGHTRLREWVFGGFTETVLSGAALPVLIAH